MAVLAVLAAGLLPTAAGAEGRYERRRAKRGEVTDTSAKLGTFAFIDDREEPPLRLAAFVDAGGFRDPLLPDLVPVRVGVAYRGKGPPLALSPVGFRLHGEGLEGPLTALTQEEMLALPMGRAALGHAGRALAARHAPLPFGETDGLRVPTRFHSDPAAGVELNDDTELPAGSWFTDVVFFRLPEGFDPWGPLLRLSFVSGPARATGVASPLVEVRFRVEEDPELHRKAFRRARKARKKEDARARKEQRRAARAAPSEASPPR